MREPRYYFIRANGDTAHNNPADAHLYKEGELPRFPKTYFNHVERCLQHGYARMGWPAVGDLNRHSEIKPKTDYKDFSDLNWQQLIQFKHIQINDAIVLPEKGRNVQYLGVVTRRYSYFYDLPEHPFECAHRIGIRWLQNPKGQWAQFRRDQLCIPNSGYPMLLALAELRKPDQVRAVKAELLKAG